MYLRFWKERETNYKNGGRDELDSNRKAPSDVYAMGVIPERHRVPNPAAKLVNVYISHAGTGHEIPEADSQSGNEADMVHYDKPASLFCGSDLATGEITVSNWYVALLLQDRQKLRTSGTAARWSRRWRSRLQR
jgi:hypothetical protein